MREAPNCERKCEKQLVVRKCVGNGLKCQFARETAESAIMHPPHLNFAYGNKSNIIWKPITSVLCDFRLHVITSPGPMYQVNKINRYWQLILIKFKKIFWK